MAASTRSIFTDIAGLLQRGESVAVCTIMEKTGSAPRAEGAKMVVATDGSTIGSVGGGGIEAEMAARAREAISRRLTAIYPFRLSGEDAAGCDMICGGAGRILVDFVDASSDDARAVFSEAAAVIESGGRAWLVTDLSGAGGGTPADGSPRCLILPSGRSVGALRPATELVDKLVSGPARNTFQPFILDESRYFVEPLRQRGTAIVFGAGHVARTIAPLCAGVGFATRVIDDRTVMMDRRRFPDPIELTVIDSFGELPPMELDGDSYVVIVTRGHQHDRDVLMKALRSSAGYIGMMGSRRKREVLFKDLLAQGFTEKDLARVHTPIGLAIGAQTPEEIAVSVVAELIAVRAAREGPAR